MNDIGSNVANNLPMDLLWEILIRIPCIKSAFKCKGVCKSWLCVISSRQFLGKVFRKHMYEATHLSPPPPFALIVRPRIAGTSKGQLLYPNNMKSDFSGRFLPDVLSRMTSDQGSSVKVTATCNDLILCGKDSWKESDHMYICNPQTMRWIALPHPRYSYSKFFVGFVCDPYYNNENKQVIDYTVVIVNCGYQGYVQNEYQFEAQIFSSQIGKWKEVTLWSPKPFKACFHSCLSLFYDGRLYFHDNGQIGMIAFNPLISSNEKDIGIGCDFIDWPLDFVKSNELLHCSHVTVSLCQGSLRMMQSIGKSVYVWDLKDHGKSEWHIKHRIVLTDYLSDFLRVPVGLLGFDPFDDATLYVCIINRIVSCNLKKNLLQPVFTIPDESKTFFPDCRAFDDFRPFWLILNHNSTRKID